MHRTYREIGNHICNEWGFDDKGDLAKIIKSIKVDMSVVCLLSAAVNELRSIREEMRYATSRQVSTSRHPVSDGMFTAIKGSTDIRLPIVASGLSARASNILDQAGIMYVSEITWERLTKLKGCGPMTASEIINWANPLSQSNEEPSCEN